MPSSEKREILIVQEIPEPDKTEVIESTEIEFAVGEESASPDWNDVREPGKAYRAWWFSCAIIVVWLCAAPGMLFVGYTAENFRRWLEGGELLSLLSIYDHNTVALVIRLALFGMILRSHYKRGSTVPKVFFSALHWLAVGLVTVGGFALLVWIVDIESSQQLFIGSIVKSSLSPDSLILPVRAGLILLASGIGFMLGLMLFGGRLAAFVCTVAVVFTLTGPGFVLWSRVQNVSWECFLSGEWEQSPIVQRIVTAAEEGDIRARRALGAYYVVQSCAPKSEENTAVGVSLLSDAAAKDAWAAAAMYRYIRWYEYIDESHYPQAVEWMREGRAREVDARYSRSAVEYHLREADCDAAADDKFLRQCFADMEKRARAGHVPAMLYTAWMYRAGRGAARELEAARHWIERAIADTEGGPELAMLKMQKEKMKLPLDPGQYLNLEK